MASKFDPIIAAAKTGEIDALQAAWAESGLPPPDELGFMDKLALGSTLATLPSGDKGLFAHYLEQPDIAQFFGAGTQQILVAMGSPKPVAPVQASKPLAQQPGKQEPGIAGVARQLGLQNATVRTASKGPSGGPGYDYAVGVRNGQRVTIYQDEGGRVHAFNTQNPRQYYGVVTRGGQVQPAPAGTAAPPPAAPAASTAGLAAPAASTAPRAGVEAGTGRVAVQQGGGGTPVAGEPTPELQAAVRNTANDLGVNPTDLMTAIAYETAGTFDPWQPGPVTQYGQHRGLIQWGEPQQERYGVYEGMPVADQMEAAGRYLKDAGVKSGASFFDIYSAINAGRAGRNAVEPTTGRSTRQNAQLAQQYFGQQVAQIMGDDAVGTYDGPALDDVAAKILSGNGLSASDITTIQRELRARGFDAPTNGKLDQKTQSAIRDYQRTTQGDTATAIRDDGVFGPRTAAQMLLDAELMQNQPARLTGGVDPTGLTGDELPADMAVVQPQFGSAPSHRVRTIGAATAFGLGLAGAIAPVGPPASGFQSTPGVASPIASMATGYRTVQNVSGEERPVSSRVAFDPVSLQVMNAITRPHSPGGATSVQEAQRELNSTLIASGALARRIRDRNRGTTSRFDADSFSTVRIDGGDRKGGGYLYDSSSFDRSLSASGSGQLYDSTRFSGRSSGDGDSSTRFDRSWSGGTSPTSRQSFDSRSEASSPSGGLSGGRLDEEDGGGFSFSDLSSSDSLSDWSGGWSI